VQHVNEAQVAKLIKKTNFFERGGRKKSSSNEEGGVLGGRKNEFLGGVQSTCARYYGGDTEQGLNFQKDLGMTSPR